MSNAQGPGPYDPAAGHPAPGHPAPGQAPPAQNQPGPQTPAPGQPQQGAPGGYAQPGAPGHPQQGAPGGYAQPGAYPQQGAPGGYAQPGAPGYPQQGAPGGYAQPGAYPQQGAPGGYAHPGYGPNGMPLQPQGDMPSWARIVARVGLGLGVLLVLAAAVGGFMSESLGVMFLQLTGGPLGFGIVATLLTKKNARGGPGKPLGLGCLAGFMLSAMVMIFFVAIWPSL